MYGNYRRAALLGGLASGLLLLLYVLVRYLVGRPISAPQTYGSDLLLLASMLGVAYVYRRRLPDERVTFKELMLLCLGLGVIASAVYGLFLWLYGQAIDTHFAQRCVEGWLMGMDTSGAEDNQHASTVVAQYTVVNWALTGAVRTAIMSILEAFVAALVFRTEKGNLK
ncbi:MAG: DUF4199 domain-containing protein [Bacteroidales bacterium]|nr:DUF4199 domain-containing protein [Bacteroidales bacterium]